MSLSMWTIEHNNSAVEADAYKIRVGHGWGRASGSGSAVGSCSGSGRRAGGNDQGDGGYITSREGRSALVVSGGRVLSGRHTRVQEVQEGQPMQVVFYG